MHAIRIQPAFASCRTACCNTGYDEFVKELKKVLTDGTISSTAMIAEIVDAITEKGVH